MNATRRILPPTLLAALAALAPPGIAQSGSDAPPGPVVHLVGHHDDAGGTSDVASRGVVTADLVANPPRPRTGELLEFVPGRIVTRHGGDG